MTRRLLIAATVLVVHSLLTGATVAGEPPAAPARVAALVDEADLTRDTAGELFEEESHYTHDDLLEREGHDLGGEHELESEHERAEGGHGEGEGEGDHDGGGEGDDD